MGFLSSATEWAARPQGSWPVKSRLTPYSIIMIVPLMTTPRCLAVTLGAFRERANRLADAIQLANQAIHQAAATHPQQAGMGSTIVAVSAWGSRFSIAHVGDSRIYLIRGGGIQQLTNDHSLVMEQVRRGLITAEEAEHSKMQNVIVRALGTEESVEPDLADHELRLGDVLLLCSDGLSRFVKEEQIVEVVGRATSLEKACAELIELAKTGGSDDNITCLLLATTEQPWHQRLVDRLEVAGATTHDGVRRRIRLGSPVKTALLFQCATWGTQRIPTTRTPGMD